MENKQELKQKGKQVIKEKYNVEIKNQNELYSLQNKVYEYLIKKQGYKATELITNEVKKRYTIYSPRSDIKTELWIYHEGIYIPYGKSYVKEFTRKLFGKAYTDAKANQVIAKLEADTMINEKDFFKNDNLNEICLSNGILNLTTKKLTSFTPNKFFFNKLPVKYDPNATCELIDKFLEDVLSCEEDIQIIYEIGGFALYREYFIEKAIMFVGDGRNGKGKTLELLKRFVGSENTCSVSLEAMEYVSTGLCELHNRLINLGGDLNNTSLKKTGMFKSLTGRDTVQAKRKYLKDLIFQNYAKHVFACNELPKVYDNSDGFWDRWIVLKFPYKFIHKKEFINLKEKDKKNYKILDPTIIDKITSQEQMSGFLNKCLDSLENLKKKKDFSFGKESQEVKEFWIRNSDSFRSFCIDCLKESTFDHITKESLRKKYLEYRKKHKLKKGESDYSIKFTLQELFGVDEQRKNFYDLDHNLIGTKSVWMGVMFKC